MGKAGPFAPDHAGNNPLDSPAVHFEITRHLPDGWGPIIDTDVDGVASKPLALDRDNPSLGRYSACRRVTRTIFVGSAPSVAAQRVRGIEESALNSAVPNRERCRQFWRRPASFK